VMSTHCVQTRKAHMFAAARKDTKGMDAFAEILTNVLMPYPCAGVELSVLI